MSPRCLRQLCVYADVLPCNVVALQSADGGYSDGAASHVQPPPVALGVAPVADEPFLAGADGHGSPH